MKCNRNQIFNTEYTTVHRVTSPTLCCILRHGMLEGVSWN